jgi:hypothetical protein
MYGILVLSLKKLYKSDEYDAYIHAPGTVTPDLRIAL